MAGAELSDGFTRVANEVIEEVARQKFNGIQLRILLIVWRQTYGWRRKSAELSVTFLANALQSDPRGIRKEMKKLLDDKVLKVFHEAKGKHGRMIGFNKYYDQWFEGENSPSQNSEQSGGESYPHERDDYTPLVGDNSPSKKEKKESIKKDNKNNKGAAKEMASKTKLAKSREGKQEYAEEVWLKPEEHTKLLNEFGQEGLTWMIDVLSSYKLSVDKFYASDYAVFKKGGWLRMKYEDHLAKQNKPVFQSKSERTKSVLDEAMAKELNGDGTGRRDITNEVHQLGLPELRS
ncbi:replication protein [Paenibacillus pabuli]|uniref:replication protein n=1 Tax=Paenibacillus pabuli TaxID=1472 RepID=UPI001FFF1722|nr:replication protein [Paenibacillus pabuli]UPK45928.1 replication protein [Paenibacillus pabuli]